MWNAVPHQLVDAVPEPRPSYQVPPNIDMPGENDKLRTNKNTPDWKKVGQSKTPPSFGADNIDYQERKQSKNVSFPKDLSNQELKN